MQQILKSAQLGSNQNLQSKKNVREKGFKTIFQAHKKLALLLTICIDFCCSCLIRCQNVWALFIYLFKVSILKYVLATNPPLLTKVTKISISSSDDAIVQLKPGPYRRGRSPRTVFPKDGIFRVQSAFSTAQSQT